VDCWRCITGRFRHHPDYSGVWHEARNALDLGALSGVITLLLGLLILAHWPINSVYMLGLFLGIDLIVAGTGWIGIGLGLRRGAAPSQLRSPA
jgi:uncharacterized membrane protein HdeD (DUF308 family)